MKTHQISPLKSGGFCGYFQNHYLKQDVRCQSGLQMAKMGEVLKRDLKLRCTAQVQSDSDDTSCDMFDQLETRKPLI